MNERELTCPVCGTVFTTNHPSKKYCSAECYRIKNLEKMRDWGKANRDKVRERQRLYRQNHRQAINKYNRKYYHDHIEKMRKKNREYYYRNKERFKEYNRAYYSKRKARDCCLQHGGIDNCPYPDCICN